MNHYLLARFLFLAACIVIPKINASDPQVEPKKEPNPVPKVAAGPNSAKEWYEQGQKAIESSLKLRAQSSTARNVILFVGDGMSVATVTAARILEGQLRGESGEENLLSFEKFPYVALSKTYSVNQQTPDSAPTMTAMVTGVKTGAGLIAVDQDTVRGSYQTVAGNELKTILELAESHGKSTGVVSTARITHATPAACYSHSPDRDWEDDSEMTSEAIAANFPDIARQLIEFPIGDGLEVVLGGGRRHFIPKAVADPEDATRKGQRNDGRNLTTEWTASQQRAKYVWNQSQFQAVAPNQVDHLLGLFSWSHMSYEHDRKSDPAGEPSLSEMTAKAIDILNRNPKGYFLHVEGGRIDHAHHDNNAYRALTDTIEFARAVQVALQKVNLKETLIIVSADHAHVFTISGYPVRGNKILGKVFEEGGQGKAQTILARDIHGLPYTTLNYMNGPGGKPAATQSDSKTPETCGENVRQDLTNVNTEDPDYVQQTGIILEDETHSGEDVVIYATGPYSHLIHGVQEQSIIFHVMRKAFGFSGS